MFLKSTSDVVHWLRKTFLGDRLEGNSNVSSINIVWLVSKIDPIMSILHCNYKRRGYESIYMDAIKKVLAFEF